MNATSGNLTKPPAPDRPREATRPDEPRRPPSLLEQRQGERFARLLREKSTRADETGEREPAPATAVPANEGQPVAGLVFGAQRRCAGEGKDELPTAGVAAPSHSSASGRTEPAPGDAPHTSADADVSASRAAIDARLNAEPAQSVLARSADASWTATLREPLGVAIEVRATRMTPDAAPAGRAGWSLTIAAPAVDTSMLTRHAPRLSERLKTRAIEHTHVRIQRDDEEPA